MLRLTQIIVLMAILVGCNTVKNAQEPQQHDHITYSRFECFGKCPVFKMEVTEEGQMTFEGTKHVEALGNHHGKALHEDYLTLNKLFLESKFDQFSTSYLSTISDLPKIEIQFNNHTVIFHEKEAPEELKAILKQLEKMRSETHWKQQ